MLCPQMGAAVAMQSSFHLTCVTHPFPLWDRHSSMISLPFLVHLLFSWNITGMTQGPETNNKSVTILILQSKTWNSCCFEWALTFNPDLFQENINRFCLKADAQVFVSKCRPCLALIGFFQLLCGKKS